MPKLRKVKSSSHASPHRVKVVWLTLLATMTAVGGFLVLLDRGVAPRADGVSLTPLASAGVSNSIDSIFETAAALDSKRWTSIVIHHSGSGAGGPASIETQHRSLGLKGLGHHFIIGNGRGGEMADGGLYLGFRWLEQLPGAHALGTRRDDLNQHALSICLVGDGNRSPFTKPQMARLNQLVDALRTRLNIPADKIYLASDVAETRDPGVQFPEAQFKGRLTAVR
ncbi:hypothetical protein BH11PLA1_BH11PLA1_02410 [soil metagenome]